MSSANGAAATITPDRVLEEIKKRAAVERDGNLMLLAVRPEDIVKKQIESGSKSKTLNMDPIVRALGRGQLLPQPYDLSVLVALSEYNSMLGPAIDAMKRNIAGFGYKFAHLVKDEQGNVPVALKDEAERERLRLHNFFRYVYPDGSFTELRSKTRVALEKTGNAYQEVIRTRGGSIFALNYVQPQTVWLSKMDDEPISVRSKRLLFQEDGTMKLVEVEEWRRFRRYVQRRGQKMVWFKQYGDPRVLDSKSGDYLLDPAAIRETPREDWANELVHFRIHSDRTGYGIPRWIGAMLAAYGERAAEEINYVTFKNNDVPSLAIAVSNGQLTGGSIDRINTFVRNVIQGSSNYSKFLVLEAEGLYESQETGNIKVEITPLTRQQHTDELFQKYTENSRNKVRQQFRISGVFVGEDEGFNKATAHEARMVTDEQVFAPERQDDDDWINRYIMPELDARFHVFQSNSPNLTSPTDLVRISATAEKSGGMTPAIARRILEDALGVELGPVVETDDFNPNEPFSLSVVRLAKNQGEPGSSVAPPARGGEESDVVRKSTSGIITPQEVVHTLLAWRDGEQSGEE